MKQSIFNFACCLLDGGFEVSFSISKEFIYMQSISRQLYGISEHFCSYTEIKIFQYNFIELC